MKKLFILFAVFVLSTSFDQKDVTWVAIGDSITYLNDHQNETGDRVTKGYMTMVTEKLPYIHFTNQGHNGWTAVRIAEQFDKLGVEKADVYSVFLGTNDWWHSGPLGEFSDYQNNTGTGTVYGSFRIIVDRIRNLNSGAKVILITPMPRTDFVYIRNPKNNAYGSYREKSGQTLEQFANAVLQIGKSEGFKVVDLYHMKELKVKNLVKFKRLRDPKTGAYKNYPYPEYVDIPFDPEKDEYPYPVEAIDLTYDGLHPSDKGYKIISDRLIKIMSKY